MKSRLIHHFKVSGWKVNFQDGFWRASWIYADYEICTKMPSWQRSCCFF